MRITKIISITFYYIRSFLLVAFYMLFIPAAAHAELNIESVYPTFGLLGEVSQTQARPGRIGHKRDAPVSGL